MLSKAYLFIILITFSFQGSAYPLDLDDIVEQLDKLDKKVDRLSDKVKEEKDELEKLLPKELRDKLNKDIEKKLLVLMGKEINLNKKEKRLLKHIFGNTLNIDKIKLYHKGIFSKRASRAIKNTIFFNKAHNLADKTYRRSAQFYMSFVHEATHVWQYQNKGTYYIVDSLFSQAVGYVVHNTRTQAYVYHLNEENFFQDYNSEQQAKMIEEYVGLRFFNVIPYRCSNYNKLGRKNYLDEVESLIETDINENFIIKTTIE